MVSQGLVSKIFAGIGVLFGLSSVATLVMGNPLTGIGLAILALGSEYASSIHE